MEQQLTRMKENLIQLCDAPGVAGAERTVAELAHRLLLPYANNATIDPFHNVSGVVRLPEEGEPMVLLEAHLDQIGLIVTHIESDGFLRMSDCGGVDRRTAAGQEVLVYGKGDRPLVGVVTTTPPHLQKEKVDENAPIEDLLLDMGLSEEALLEQVSLGDRGLFRSPLCTTLGDRVVAAALDNRAGVAAVLEALALLEKIPLPCGIAVLFSAQEEVGHRGAEIAGYHFDPDVVLSVDVSFAQTPDTTLVESKEMGKGPMLGIAPVLDSTLAQTLIDLAAQHDIPYQQEVMRGKTGTNADTLGVMRGGARTGLLLIPLKYMHTPVEMVDLVDCYHIAEWIAAYLAQPDHGATTTKRRENQ